MIGEGTFRAKGCGAELGVAGTGNEQIGVDLLILDGPDAGNHITWYGYFSEKAFDRTIESLRSLGWTGDDLSDLRGIDTKEVSIVIEHEADLEGELRARVKWINSIGGVAMKEKLDASAARAFAARMRGRVLALKQGQGQRPTAARSSAPANTNAPAGEQAPSDDIPF